MTQLTQLGEKVKANGVLIACIVIAIALVAVNIVFYMGWQSAKDEQSTLQKQLVAAQTNLNITRDQFDVVKLRQQLAELEGTPNFPASVSEVELSGFLAATAETYLGSAGIVSAVPISGTETIGGKQYAKRGFTVEVTGTTTKVNQFLRSLENGPYETLRLENLSLSGSGGKFNMVVITQG